MMCVKVIGFLGVIVGNMCGVFSSVVELSTNDSETSMSEASLVALASVAAIARQITPSCALVSRTAANNRRTTD